MLLLNPASREYNPEWARCQPLFPTHQQLFQDVRSLLGGHCLCRSSTNRSGLLQLLD